MNGCKPLPALLMSAVLAWLLCCVAGCAQINVEAQGTLPSDSRLASVKEGATTRDTLIAALGEPQYIRVLNDGKEQLVYEYRERETGERYVPLIFKQGYQKTRIVRTYFEVVNGVITRYWREKGP